MQRRLPRALPTLRRQPKRARLRLPRRHVRPAAVRAEVAQALSLLSIQPIQLLGSKRYASTQAPYVQIQAQPAPRARRVAPGQSGRLPALRRAHAAASRLPPLWDLSRARPCPGRRVGPPAVTVSIALDAMGGYLSPQAA